MLEVSVLVDYEFRDSQMCAAWIPGQGVKIDYAAIVEILIQQLDDQRAYH